MFNLHQLFPQLSAFGFFGPSPQTSNPFLSIYMASSGEVTPSDVFEVATGTPIGGEPEIIEDQFIF